MAAHLSPEQIESALELRRKFWTHHQIAAHIGVHQSTVTRALARVDRRALRDDRLRMRAVSAKAAQLDQLELIAREAMDAWERSKGAEVIVKTKKGTDGDKAVDLKETTTRHRTGEAVHLKVALESLEAARQVLGFNAADERAAKALAAKMRDDGTPAANTCPVEMGEQRAAAYDQVDQTPEDRPAPGGEP